MALLTDTFAAGAAKKSVLTYPSGSESSVRRLLPSWLRLVELSFGPGAGTRVSLLFRSFAISSNVPSRCRLRLRLACPGMNLRMPLLPETLLPSRLDSWLTMLGDFSRVESADPLKPPPGLPTSSLFRPRREIELALLNTFFTALRGGEVTGEGAVGDSMVPQGNPKLVACARLAAGITLA
jgi:hypothetical protein